MKKRFVFMMLFVTILTFSACSTSNQNDGSKSETSIREQTIEQEPTHAETVETTKTNEPADEIDPIKEQIMKMTLAEKIGQMIIVGFDGYQINENVESMIKNNHVGGFILFRGNIQNPNQLHELINSIKSVNSYNKVPLFMSVDEEGGRISRMPEQMHKLPSNQMIGEANNSTFSFEVGGILAGEIKAFGFNMDFAPVLDIYSNPKNTVIGDRAFGSNAEIVSKLGIQTMKGIREEGVIPVVKHFPGHGDSLVDSHVGLPTVSHDMERLKNFELVPFEAAIDNQADAVMIAHILMSRIDPENPASLSKIIITDILRRQMGFEGVVITDDMTMGAIEKNYKIGDAVIKSVNAGSDIILVCHGYDKQVAAIKALKAAVESGTIPEESINESVYRILKLKSKYKLTDAATAPIDIDKINQKIDSVLNTYMQQ